jgi:ribosomal-protein-serine acetyltransferase
MITLNISDDICLKQLNPKMSNELFNLVEKNRSHLREYLPWLDNSKTEEDTVYFLKAMGDLYRKNGSPHFAIYFKEKIIGIAGYHLLDQTTKKSSIGYWLDKDNCKKGIMTIVTKAIVDYGFKELKLNRISLICCTDNIGSNRVAIKLGFQFEGTMRESEWLYDRFVDVNSYACLKSEWD